ncbi:hypothetical protein KI387_023271, partial [Taxus chinensis]
MKIDGLWREERMVEEVEDGLGWMESGVEKGDATGYSICGRMREGEMNAETEKNLVAATEENLNAGTDETRAARTEENVATETKENLAAGKEERLAAESGEILATEAAESHGSLSSGQLLENEILKCGNLQASLESNATESEVSKIREEFDAARQVFQNIPAALRMMPKMDPCGIYANDNLRMDQIEVYGFDYDYTVAHYTGSLQTLIYDLAKEHIVKESRYPESCLQFQYDPNFPIRGLFYDKKRGCLLKLDFFHCIETDGCYYGRRKMSREEVEGIYGNRHISRDYAPNLIGLMDLFCFSEACLISDIIQHFVDEKLDFDAFYMEECALCSRCYDKEKDILTFSKVDAFEPYKIYYHGCLKSFLEITKWKGNEVMYFGDHLFSDLRGPAKAGWRTAAIIGELEREIMIQNEDKYRFQQAKFHIVQELLGKFHSLLTKKPRGDADNALLQALNEERQKSRHAMKTMFNSYFGAAFLTDTGKESAFAYNIQRYADVYTSKLENFLNYSSEAWLHTPYDVKIMPHHVK